MRFDQANVCETIITTALLIVLATAFEPAHAQSPQYPRPQDYMMPRDAEVALAKSAAPSNISEGATIKVLTPSGYDVARQETMVLFAW